MATKLAINGFGRIGRNILRALMERGDDDLQVVAINDLAPLETNAHLFEFDSVHGRFGRPVTLGDNTMDVGQGPIRVTAERDPAALPWGDVDIVLECTGIFTTREAAAKHLANGSKRVVISAPGKDAMKTIVYGVNHDLITAEDTVLSNASCTTNCMAPLAKTLHDAFGIKHGHMTTIHSYTGDQPVHDTAHSDLYRARAAALSMIPTTTGAAKTLGKVLPELDGLIGGTAIRVPTPNVSCVDLVVELSKDTTVEEVNATLRTAAEGPLKGILGLVERPLVSIDLNHDSHSCVVALDQTSVQSGTQLRVLGWYDNEWGFSNRMLDTSREVAKTL
ncbi:type I glyceraldehyde-3-phosphate dehydrogenase [Sulfitobacter pontiacus]|uniref:type I glyceraldehyde-3-phosphate dehydrogenase n=1 Tax=Sulfitobacter pontiacus TaxID=60137 RepID=UPI00044F59F2|nr:type I glyceraldehyde-3-phosphate dehydrogenase [Sulfitobacter pontiacus]KAJ31650.1 glyceraldehyde-3-phosphate dehydrogenase [Sulfitobacter pontiacus 3SOLIMAR09]